MFATTDDAQKITFFAVCGKNAVEKGVKSITMNGRQVRKLPVLPVGTVCDVEVVMG